VPPVSETPLNREKTLSYKDKFIALAGGKVHLRGSESLLKRSKYLPCPFTSSTVPWSSQPKPKLNTQRRCLLLKNVYIGPGDQK
jgi:hypothetical protein